MFSKSLFCVIVSWLFVDAYGRFADMDITIVKEDSICANNIEKFLFHSAKQDPKTLKECEKLCYNDVNCKYFSYGSPDVKDQALQGACLGCYSDTKFKKEKGFDTYENTKFKKEEGFDNYELSEDDAQSDAYENVVTRGSTRSQGVPVCLPTIGKELSLKGSTLIKSDLDSHNLNGSIRYRNVCPDCINSIDLEVTVKKGEGYDMNETISVNGFRCKDDDDGLVNDCTSDFGTINLVSHLSTVLQFRLLDSKTNEPGEVEGFYITIFDVDESRVREEFVVTGFDSAKYDEDSTEVDFNCCSEPGVDENYLEARSKKFGRGCDNPVNINSFAGTCDETFAISEERVKKRSFMVGFQHKSEFEITFKTPCGNTCSRKDGQIGGGRNMLFTFRSTLADCTYEECPEKKKVSICIALDESASVCDKKALYGIGCPNWDSVKNFTKTLISELHESTEDSEFGIVSFEQSVKLHTELTYAEDASQKVDEIIYTGGPTNTQGAIEECRNVLKEVSDERFKYIFLVTDGFPTVDSTDKKYEGEGECTSCNADATEQAELAKKADITFVTVEVETKETDGSLLEELASDAVNYFKVGSFDDLYSSVQAIVNRVNVCVRGLE